MNKQTFSGSFCQSFSLAALEKIKTFAQMQPQGQSRQMITTYTAEMVQILTLIKLGFSWWFNIYQEKGKYSSVIEEVDDWQLSYV